jgi:hypothetical protein
MVTQDAVIKSASSGFHHYILSFKANRIPSATNAIPKTIANFVLSDSR